MARVQAWRGDICDLEVDAIVNPASVTLWMSSGVGAALKKRGGDSIEIAAVRMAPIALGETVVTPAGSLSARHVLHAATLDRGHRTSREAVAAAATSAILRAGELGLHSIAIPALGAGAGGLDPDTSAEATVPAVRDALRQAPSIRRVIFALQNPDVFAAYFDAVADLEGSFESETPA
jgi:O-acetyl-ADP-ribose deacetylase (regulator of RNase III)